MDEKTLISIIYSKALQIVGILLKGDRVEIIPVKDGVRIFRIRREEIKK